MTPERIGPYVLLSPLGKGGMGHVHRARHEVLGREVALKLLDPGRVIDDEARERFRREMLAMRDVVHPGLVRIFEGDWSGDFPYMAMELIEGSTLRALLTPNAHLPWPYAIAVLVRLLEALEALHEARIVHRDVKPSNIMIDGAGEPRLLDLGLTVAPGQHRITLTGMFLGTIGYTAPEVLMGEESTPASDLYGAGLTAYEMVTGQKSLLGTGAEDHLRRVLEGNRPPPSRYDSRIPQEIDDFLLRMVDTDPGARPSSAQRAAAVAGKHLRERTGTDPAEWLLPGGPAAVETMAKRLIGNPGTKAPPGRPEAGRPVAPTTTADMTRSPGPLATAEMSRPPPGPRTAPVTEITTGEIVAGEATPRWPVAVFAGALALGLAVTLWPGSGQPPPPAPDPAATGSVEGVSPLILPPAPASPGPSDPSGSPAGAPQAVSKRWRSLEPWAARLRQTRPLSREETARMEEVTGVTLGDVAEGWEFWRELGAWLEDDAARPPPRSPGAHKGPMSTVDGFLFKGLMRGADAAPTPALFSIVLRWLTTYPDDLVSWLLLVRFLDLEGRLPARDRVVAHVLPRLDPAHPPPLAHHAWEALPLALAMAPGHRLEEEWGRWTAAIGNPMRSWQGLVEALWNRDRGRLEGLMRQGLARSLDRRAAALYLGRSLLERGNRIEATRIWEQALVHEPDAMEILADIYLLHLGQGDVDAARVALAKLPPDRWEHRVQVYVDETPPIAAERFRAMPTLPYHLLALRLLEEGGKESLATEIERVGYSRIPGVVSLELLGAGHTDPRAFEQAGAMLRGEALIARLRDAMGPLSQEAGRPMAEKLLDRAASMGASPAQLRLARALWLARGGKMVAALELLARGLEETKPLQDDGLVHHEILTRALWEDLMAGRPGRHTGGPLHGKLRELNPPLAEDIDLLEIRDHDRYEERSIDQWTRDRNDLFRGLSLMRVAAIRRDARRLDEWDRCLRARVVWRGGGFWALDEARALRASLGEAGSRWRPLEVPPVER